MLYPPILASTQSVFASSVIEINFTVASVTSVQKDGINGIDILVAKQSNNKSVVDTTQYPTGIIHRNWDISQGYTITINYTELNKDWQTGCLYKIQLRFVASNSTEEVFSEWSTVMIVKPISCPILTIRKDESIYIVTGRTGLMGSLTPTFFGKCDIDVKDKEVEESYKFDLYDGNNLLETSGWQFHVPGEEDKIYFKTLLENQNQYTIIYHIKTNNGYYSSLSENFVAINSTLGDLDNVRIQTKFDSDNARVLVQIKEINEELLSGNFIITRTSETSDFKLYEDLKYLNYFQQNFSDWTTCFIDYTVESGITYKYAIQKINKYGIRTNPKISQPIEVDFDYAYLCRNGTQLRLTFNQKMSSFKHSVLRSKQDTIGDKYPHLLQNGNAYYAEFPITGLITYQGNTNTFLKIGSDGMYYNNEMVIKEDKFEERAGYRSDGTTSIDYSISTDLTQDNIFIERKFREKVEEFLNDFNCKLYRSPTEGNIVVNLMNISMSPNESLGRMIYEFSATAYEVLENNLENLDKYGVIDIGEVEDIIDTNRTYYNFGQKVYWPNATSLNIYREIKQDQEITIEVNSETYKYKVQRITSFWIEPYPKEKLKAMIEEREVEGRNSSLLLKYYNQVPDNLPFKFKIGDKEILVSPCKIYSVTDYNITSFELIKPIDNDDYDYDYPMLINYTVDLKLQKQSSVQITGYSAFTQDVGQVSGIFSINADVLRQYNLNYSDASSDLIIAQNGDYNIYKSKNLVDIIKDAVKRDIEKVNGITLSLQNDGTWKGSDGREYRFDGISSLTVEGECYQGHWENIEGNNEFIVDTEGTKIKIGESEDVYCTYEIGKNYEIPEDNSFLAVRFAANKIFFEDISGHANYIEFGDDTTFAIVDFTYSLFMAESVEIG